MKILIAIQYYFPHRSGVTEYARLLAEGLVSKGHEVTVLTSRSFSGLPLEERIKGVRVIRVPVWLQVSRGSFMPGFLPRLIGLSAKQDIINLHFPIPECLPAAFLARKSKVVVTYHCDLTLEGGVLMKALEGLYFKLQSLSFRLADAIISSHTGYAENSALKNFLEKVESISPPVKPLSRKDPGPFKSKFKISGHPVIGFLGRIVFEKGLDNLIGAMKRVQKHYPDALLLIGGETEKVVGGTVTARLKKEAEARGVKIDFTGFIPDEWLEAFYSACDVFVLPSVDRLEAFGMVQVEAMYCGTPVVASDRPGVRVPVSRTGMGRLARPGDSESLGSEIIEVINNRVKYIRDPDEILNSFGLEITVHDYEKLFARVVGAKG